MVGRELGEEMRQPQPPPVLVSCCCLDAILQGQFGMGDKRVARLLNSEWFIVESGNLGTLAFKPGTWNLEPGTSNLKLELKL